MPTVDVFISLVLALLMFSVGSSVKFKDFKHIFKDSKPLFFGLSLQIFLLPLIAFTICLMAPLDPLFKLGIMILSLSPGGATSNFISYLLDLKTALSLSLTFINSLVILITIPLGVSFFSQYFLGETSTLKLDWIATIKDISLLILIPVFIGITFRQMWSSLYEKSKTIVKYGSTFLLGLVFVIKYFASEEKGGSGLTITETLNILPYILLVHLLSMFLSYFLARINKIEQFESLTISIEVGLQNTTLALLVSSVYLANNQVSKPALVYAMFSFFTTFIFGYITKRTTLKTD